IGEAGKRGATTAQRAHRLRRQVHRVLQAVPEGAALAVIEGPAYGAQHGGQHERAGLWWALYVGLTARRIPIAVCNPQTRAKFATGAGNADKTAVLDAMRHHWTTADIRDHNQADALALATAGGMRLLWHRPEADHHEDALAAIEWPDAVKVELAQRLKAGW
ncbi:hypothetical protein G6026_01865, partial [Dietzia sp. DQ11-38-2]